MNHSGYYHQDACDLGAFEAIINQRLTSDDVPHAAEIKSNIPVYDAAALAGPLGGDAGRRALMSEWAWVLGQGSGVLVIRQAQPDHGAIDAASRAFESIIADERAAGGSGADHFAAAGANDRIWNSLQKLCLADPETFLRYHACPAIDTASEAWLGPNYQMTAQVNLVHPGGKAQQAHRDYHLGFQTAEISASYPAQVHHLSPLMTLQGGLAHCDMDIEAGPTKLLPFSQTYLPGYAAWRRDDFRALFEERCVQMKMSKGDAIFFSPALFHAAGENRTTDVHRMVNLFQVSSAFGRAMETIDRAAMCRALLGPLQSAQLDGPALSAVIASTAEGYSFPTNLDNDPPIGGLAPETQAAILRKAVDGGWDSAQLGEALDDLARRQRP